MKNVRNAMNRKELNKDFEIGDKEAIASSGIDLTEETRSASFLQQDGNVEFYRSLIEGVEITSTDNALKNIPEAKEYYGSNFKSLGRDFPQDTEGGYFIRVKKNTKVHLPIQACLFLKAQGFKQKVHNLIIIEEGAQVYLITGCSASHAAHEGFHLGISEFFIKKGGYLNFTMIHSWKEDVSVNPMSVALLDEEATFISNYVCLKPVRDITMYPTAVLQGKNSRASFNSLLLSHPNSLQDIGSRVILRAKNTQAEIIARAVSLGGKVIARGHIKAEDKDVKAHLECRGLILSEKGSIHAIPEMESDFRDVDMSHEAAIGKINKDEIEYLTSRGFTAPQAQSIIIRGFMDVEVLALPDLLKKEITSIEENTLNTAF
ncbi:MAG: SufD family Fe-S cluster assembly protein [Candidatus Omnitrophica bacterium]|nr:SufD family Fe-S cluster assembly protein [Candidatus Omnitrophota bacterium]